MSGGHFNYIQDAIDEAALETSSLIEGYKQTCTPETILRLEETVQVLELASLMLQRADWFISGDDGEDLFNKRWDALVLHKKNTFTLEKETSKQ